MLGSFTCFFIILVAVLVPNVKGQRSIWTYKCIEKLCQRSELTAELTQVPMEVCKLNCDPLGSLLPFPTGKVTLGQTLSAFHMSNITFRGYENYPAETKEMIENATQIFNSYLQVMGESETSRDNNLLSVEIKLNRPTDLGIKLVLNDEAYNLTISNNNLVTNVSIVGETFYGARHALETLAQLIAFDDSIGLWQIVNEVEIEDKPVYAYRGIAVDTSRNFISLVKLRKVIDGLSYNKLNVFHWHLIDSHSFPMEVRGRPKMTEYGAYGPNKIYTLSEMAELVKYARVRGVKVVPEFDQPAHNGFGWQWGPEEGLGNLTVCIDKQPWHEFCVEPPCGQLNLINDNMYNILGEIFGSMLDIFDNDLFHMGGDEVDFRCYNTTDEITNWMGANNYTRDVLGFVKLWARFQSFAHEKLLNASTNKEIQTILWTSELTKAENAQLYLPKEKYIIQIWTEAENEMIPELINLGYRTIFSNYDALYLDCGFHAWIGNGHNWCSPYKSWQTVYENNPHKIYANKTNETVADNALERGLLFGAEAPLWMEQADDLSIENRLFPRASALAERLWSNPQNTWEGAEYRMVTNRQRYVLRGVNPDRIQPEFCSAYQGRCYGPPVSDDSDDKSLGITLGKGFFVFVISLVLHFV